MHDDELIGLLNKLIEKNSEERKELTSTFASGMSRLESEMRNMRTTVIVGMITTMFLLIAVAAARDGVFAEVGIPGVTVKTKPTLDEPVKVQEVGRDRDG